MKSTSNNFQPRVVVITGASSGIGKALYSLFKANGDKVVGLARTEMEGITPCDITNREQVLSTFEKIAKEHKKIDILINNAGFGVSGATELVDYADIDREYSVNIMGALNCYKSALQFMGKGSKIINIASACSLFPLPYRSLYCSSKAGLHMLSLSLNMECKPLGVQVVSICPGDVKTNFTKNRVKVFKTSPKYGDRIKLATSAIDSRENKRMSVEVVSKKIFKICNGNKVKPFVIIGAKYKFLHFAMRFLPMSALLFFTEKFFGGHKKTKEEK